MRNKEKCHRSNNTFGKLNPQADTSFAKRVISADPHSRTNRTEKQITDKETHIGTKKISINNLEKLKIKILNLKLKIDRLPSTIL